MRKLQRLILALSLLGFLFAGSVTTRQFFSPTTVPGVFSCVGLSIFELSPCPYGFTAFAALTALSGFMLWRGPTMARLWVLRLVALVGVMFSGWVVWREIGVPALARGSAYWATFEIARVPACAWGFLLFVVVALLTWKIKPLPQTVQPA